MSAHTPGPWPIEGWSAGDSVGWYIRLGTDDNAQRLDVYDDTQSSEADARLIAAAPELLEALRTALAFVAAFAGGYQYQHGLASLHPEHQKALDQCQSAIAKAEGRS